MCPMFSILVVCLNPGAKLKDTLKSIVGQTYSNYEIVVKDGLSTDGSIAYIEKLEENQENAVLAGENPIFPKLKLIEKKDSGIYDAMNQAVQASEGKYLYFLNCGDRFYDETVLQKMAAMIKEKPSENGIYYGNIYERLTGQEVFSNPRLNTFACYRNVPCHQACFYDRKLLLSHPFDTSYRVRADYEQFLWCFLAEEAGCVFFRHEDILIADYEGGGFSETKESRKRSKKEHQEIVHKYMTPMQILRYKVILAITFAPLRTKMAENAKTAGFYNALKKKLYRGKNR